MKKSPIRRDYDAFAWLPLERWKTDTIMGPKHPYLRKIFCKICDKYIDMSQSESHVKKHVAARKKQITDDRKKAVEARLEAARLARLKKQEIAGKL